MASGGLDGAVVRAAVVGVVSGVLYGSAVVQQWLAQQCVCVCAATIRLSIPQLIGGSPECRHSEHYVGAAGPGVVAVVAIVVVFPKGDFPLGHWVCFPCGTIQWIPHHRPLRRRH